MMVEDNPDHALLIKRGIEGPDCTVRHFEDGLEALEACEANQSEEAKPDLILLDLQLPGLDGFSIMERLRKIKAYEHVPIVMLTTSARQKEISQAYALGASGYVVKSDDFQMFMTKLKHIKNYWFQTVELPEKNGGTHAS